MFLENNTTENPKLLFSDMGDEWNSEKHVMSASQDRLNQTRRELEESSADQVEILADKSVWTKCSQSTVYLPTAAVPKISNTVVTLFKQIP